MTISSWLFVIGINVALFGTVGFCVGSQRGCRIVSAVKRLRIAMLENHLDDLRDRLARWDYYSDPSHSEWEDEKTGRTPWRAT